MRSVAPAIHPGQQRQRLVQVLVALTQHLIGYPEMGEPESLGELRELANGTQIVLELPHGKRYAYSHVNPP